MATDYQAIGSRSNGLIIDGPGVEIVVGYSRDHDRLCGAGTAKAKLGLGVVVFHRVPDMHELFPQRFFANVLHYSFSPYPGLP